MANARGRDISYWNTITDWGLFSQNTDIVLMKTSQRLVEDTSFRGKWAGARSKNMRIGLWHFMQPNFEGTAQGHFFVQIYKSLGVKLRFLALDCEEISYDDRTTDPPTHIQIDPTSKEAYTLWVMQFLNVVEAETGIVPGIYTRANFWDTWVYPSNTKFSYGGVEYTTPDWSRYFLWVANYYVSSPTLPRDWSKWLFWQPDATTIPGASGPVDRDVFNGDVAALDLWLGTSTVPPVDYTGVKLSWPCNTAFQITQKFGENPAYYQMFGLPGHEGIDFGAIMGSPIYSMLESGVVEAVNSQGAYGIHVILRHALASGLVVHTYYCHLSSAGVVVGQSVQQGQQVGLSGSTGNSTGPHLHITVKVDGAQTPGYPAGIVDPYPMLVAQVPQPKYTKMKMVASGVRVRLAPGISGQIVGAVNAGDIIEITGEQEVTKDGYIFVPCRVFISRGTLNTTYGTLQ